MNICFSTHILPFLYIPFYVLAANMVLNDDSKEPTRDHYQLQAAALSSKPGLVLRFPLRQSGPKME